MLEKAKKTLMLAAAEMLAAAPVLAADPVQEISPDSFVTKVRDLLVQVGMPIGSVVLVGSLIVVAAKLMTAHGSAGKKAEAMEGLFNVALGGVVLGGALFIAGFLLGVGKWLTK